MEMNSRNASLDTLHTDITPPASTMDSNEVKEQFYSSMAFPVGAQIVLTCLYVITILLSISGNAIVIVVLSLSKRSSQNLARLLINLAVCDIVMAVFCMPFTFVNVMLGRWLFGRFMCKLVGFMQVTSVSASIYTNVVIGLDRYLAVSNPLRRKVSKLNPLILICTIWVFSIAIAAPELKVMTTSTNKRNVDNITVIYTLCRSTSSRAIKQSYCIFLVLLTYLFPLTALFSMYTLIGKLLWKQRVIPGQEDRERSLIRRRSRIKVTRMLCVLVLTFAFCWFPFHVFNIVNQFTPFPVIWKFVTDSSDVFYTIYCTCHWLAMANSFTNPIIYNFLSDDFRHDLRGTFKRVSLRSSDGPLTSNPNFPNRRSQTSHRFLSLSRKASI